MKYPETILDLGSSKAVCLIGGLGNEGLLEAYGTGVGEHEGLRKRNFLSTQSLRDAILTALEEAQNESRRAIRSVSVGVPGCFVETFCKKGELVYDAPHKFEQNDINQLIAYSLAGLQIPGGYVHLHSIPVSFKLDGETYSEPPVGIQARQTSAIISHVYMHEEFQSIVKGILEEIDVEIDAYIDAIYAESLLLIPERRKAADSVILDVGQYHSDVCLIRNEAPIFHRNLNIGGAHFASDLCYVLGLAEDVAEAIKRRHVFGLDYSERVDTYRLKDGRVESCDYDMIQNIIESRALELADMFKAALEQTPVEVGRETPVYLCGGGMAMMRGGREFLQSCLEMPVSTDLPIMPRKNSANYYSAYGVLNFVLRMEKAHRRNDWRDSALVQSVINFFTK